MNKLPSHSVQIAPSPFFNSDIHLWVRENLIPVLKNTRAPGIFARHHSVLRAAARNMRLDNNLSFNLRSYFPSAEIKRYRIFLEGEVIKYNKRMWRSQFFSLSLAAFMLFLLFLNFTSIPASIISVLMVGSFVILMMLSIASYLFINRKFTISRLLDIFCLADNDPIE